MAFIDKVIGYFNPVAGVQRQAARDALKRSYEMGGTNRRTSGWRALDESGANSERRDLKLMRNRARNLYNNSPYARRGINAIATHTVGTGIVGTINIDGKNTKQNKQRRAMLQKEFNQFCKSLEFSADGRTNFAMMQKIAMKAVARDGEIIARKVYRNGKLQIQLLEAEYLYSYTDSLKAGVNGHSKTMGISYDDYGKPISYQLYKSHPSDFSTMATNTTDVPAKDIAHVFDLGRQSSARGVPWLHAVGGKIRDFSEYEDAELLRQKLAASQVAIIKDNNNSHVNALQTATGDDLEVTWEAGTTTVLPSGFEVEFNKPLGVNSYAEFRKGQLHDIGIGLDVPYIVLTGDLSSVNFTSGRMGMLDFYKNVDSWRTQMLIPTFLNPVFNWFLEWKAIEKGYNVDGVTVSWTAPKRQMLDPARETSAIVSQIRAGLISYPEAIRQSNAEPEQVLQEIEENNKKLDAGEIVLDTDPRRTTMQGLSQAKQVSMGGAILYPDDDMPEPKTETEI